MPLPFSARTSPPGISGDVLYVDTGYHIQGMGMCEGK